ncbi:excalibur calcium-binding domain-containing protein [Peribacillus asahii]
MKLRRNFLDYIIIETFALEPKNKSRDRDKDGIACER